MPRSRNTEKTRPLRPLLVREGARFRCFGDGLCCTDIHGLGVLTRSDVRELRKRRKLSVIYNEELEGYCLRPVDGHCLFLENERCSLHAKYGPEAKPSGCRQFPYGLVQTPQGGRITTEHRCPCRTLGERPALSIEDAERSLRNRAGRLEVDRVVSDRVELSRGKRVSFAAYAKLEAQLIDRLNRGERAEDVLRAKPLPELVGTGWATVAVEHIETRDATAGGEAYGWFGDALLHLAAGHTPPQRPRPWHASFERALARSAEQPSAEAVFNDWIADEIWMFRWLAFGPFDVARAELATRLAAARCIQGFAMAQGVSAHQAAAEAVMICELVAEGGDWPDATAAIVRSPSPAEPLD